MSIFPESIVQRADGTVIVKNAVLTARDGAIVFQRIHRAEFIQNAVVTRDCFVRLRRLSGADHRHARQN